MLGILVARDRLRLSSFTFDRADAHSLGRIDMFTITMLGMVFGVCMSSSCFDKTDETDETAVAFYATAYQGNRESFANYTCEFDVVRGTCDSEVAAVQGQITTTISGSGSLIVAQDLIRYEINWDPEIIQQAFSDGLSRNERDGKADARISLPASSTGYLAGGTGTLRFAPEIGSANLFDAVDQAPFVEITPLEHECNVQ